MKNVITFFTNLIQSVEYEYNTFVGYMDEKVSYDRVLSDRKKSIDYICKYLKITSDNTEKELILSIFCNFNIKSGMAGRLEQEDDLNVLFSEIGTENKYLEQVYYNVTKQEYDNWDFVLSKNPKSVVAKIYKFVKLFSVYCQEAQNITDKVVDVDQYFKMWELYESLPEEWKEYVLGTGDLLNKASINPAINNNFLPYIEFASHRELLEEIITSYYSELLKELEIDKDIEPGFVYHEISEKMGNNTIRDYVLGDLVPIVNKMHPLVDLKTMRVRSIDPKEIYNLLRSNSELGMMVCENMEKNRDINMLLTILFEKIHRWYNDGEYEWYDSNELYPECQFSKMLPVDRCIYLHLPVRGPIKRNLFLSHYEVFLQNRSLRINAQRKKEMMDYYSHSWKHISYPQIVREIAEELSKTNVSMANRLMKAYNSEKTLQRGIELLQYSNSDDKYAVRKAFRKGIAITNSNLSRNISVNEAIFESLDLVVFRILMSESDDSNSMVRCREKWNRSVSLGFLRQQYISDFLEAEIPSNNILDWVNEHFVKISLNVSPEWESVRFKSESFALNQFKEILVELFTNYFVHGSGTLGISFDASENEFSIKTSNKSDRCEAIAGRGLGTLEKLMDAINCMSIEKSFSINIENDMFYIMVAFDKELMIRRGR